MFLKVWALLLTFGPNFSTAKNDLFLNEYCGPLRGKKSPCCMAKDWMIGGMVRLQAQPTSIKIELSHIYGQPQTEGLCCCRNHPQFGDPWVIYGYIVLQSFEKASNWDRLKDYPRFVNHHLTCSYSPC